MGLLHGFLHWDKAGRLLRGLGLGRDKWVKLPRFRKPPAAGWSWVNQGGAAVATAADGSLLLTAPPAAGDNWRLRVRTASAAPYARPVYAQPQWLGWPSVTGGESPAVAVGWRDGGTGRLALARLYFDPASSALLFDYAHWTNETTLSLVVHGPVHASFLHQGACPSLRLNDDGATRSVHFSPDGINWENSYIWSENRDNFVVNPNQLVAGANADGAFNVSLRLAAFEV